MVREELISSLELMSSSEYRPGDLVEARRLGKARYYPGLIVRMSRNGTFDIDYDDGKRERGVAGHLIRAFPSKEPERSSETPMGEDSSETADLLDNLIAKVEGRWAIADEGDTNAFPHEGMCWIKIESSRLGVTLWPGWLLAPSKQLQLMESRETTLVSDERAVYCYGDGRLVQASMDAILPFDENSPDDSEKGGRLWDTALTQAKARKACPRVFTSMIASNIDHCSSPVLLGRLWSAQLASRRTALRRKQALVVKFNVDDWWPAVVTGVWSRPDRASGQQITIEYPDKTCDDMTWPENDAFLLQDDDFVVCDSDDTQRLDAFEASSEFQSLRVRLRREAAASSDGGGGGGGGSGGSGGAVGSTFSADTAESGPGSRSGSVSESSAGLGSTKFKRQKVTPAPPPPPPPLSPQPPPSSGVESPRATHGGPNRIECAPSPSKARGSKRIARNEARPPSNTGGSKRIARGEAQPLSQSAEKKKAHGAGRQTKMQRPRRGKVKKDQLDLGKNQARQSPLLITLTRPPP